MFSVFSNSILRFRSCYKKVQIEFQSFVMKIKLKKIIVMKKITSLLILFVLVLCISCSKDEEQIVNKAPVIKSQTFSVAENVSDDFVIGTLTATDENQDPLKFSLKTDDANLFEITEDGEISLLAGKTLDFETKSSYTITAQVSDGKDKADAQVTISVTDIDENTAPVIDAQEFTIAEDITDTTEIGVVVATDAEGTTLNYSITTNDNELFVITNDGKLSLASGKILDYETKTTHTITVSVSDGSLTASNDVTIKVTDVAENTAPVIAAQEFTVAEDITDATEIGAVTATDAEGNTLSFSITTNDNGLFEITNDGKLSLANGKSLDFETTTSHTITVEVTDGSLTESNTITIKVTDVDENVNDDAFITVWKTVTPNEEIKIGINPSFIASYYYTIDWGDGTVEVNQSNSPSHVYAYPGNHTVTITGGFPAMKTPGNKLVTVKQWGTQEWKSMDSFFKRATGLETIEATDVPDLSNVTSMKSMFQEASNFNGDINNWDVSNVTDMSTMFLYATKFNQNLNNWNVSNVTNMLGMFEQASNFNGSISNWDVSNVTQMGYMFNRAKAFNQDIGNWNVGSVTQMIYMFAYAELFNQDLNNWNVSNVTNMKFMFSFAYKFNGNISNWDVSNVNTTEGMFLSTKEFNQGISNWNVSNVTNMISMFNNASKFNADISNWSVGNVTNMAYMFRSAAAFNQDISNWNVSNVTDMAAIFSGALKFNQNISNWNVSGVTNMGYMFFGAKEFNQDISSWDVSNVTDMIGMFSDATNFSQDLGNWNITKVTNASGVFSNSSMTMNNNYTKTLIGWSKLAAVPANLNLHTNTGQTYCTNYSSDAATARDFLINTKGWTIFDTVSNNCQ